MAEELPQKKFGFSFVTLVWDISCLLIVLTTFWASASFGRFTFPPPNRSDLYIALTEAFLQGQVHLKYNPDPKILALENPYDLTLRSNIPFPWDSSLYKGKFYVYFGPVPVLLLHVPWRLITGTHLDPHFAILFLSLSCLTALLACLSTIRCRFNVQGPWRLSTWGIILAFGSGLSVQLGGGVYVIAAQTALLFQLITILMLLRCHSGGGQHRFSLPYLACAGLCIGLAAGCRPTHLALLLAGVVLVFLPGRNTLFRHRLWELLALYLPASVIVTILGWYNYIRFDSWTEFGNLYQLGLADHTAAPLAGFGKFYTWRLVATQIWYHFLYPPSISSTFPYLVFPYPSPSPFKPAGYVTADHVTGIFLLIPYITVGTILSFFFWSRLSRELKRIFVAIAIPAVLVTIYLTSCRSAAARYMYEVQFPWLIIAIAVLWKAHDSIANHSSLLYRWAIRVTVTATALVSITIGFAAALDGHYSKRLDKKIPLLISTASNQTP